MYINRDPLGEGKLTFRRPRKRYPPGLILLYLIVLLAALVVFWRKDDLRPKVLALLGPTSQPTLSSQEFVSLAEEAYQAGDLDKSADYYQQASQVEPGNIEIMFDHARVLTLTQDQENLHQALNIAEEMIRLYPEDFHGYAAKARALDWLGDYDQASLAALKAVDFGPNSALAHAYLGEVYIDLGRLSQAREKLELAIQLDPYNVDARRNYALLLEHYGEYQGAIQQYLQAINLHPNILDLQYGLARNYRGSGQYEQAIVTYQEIAFQASDDPLPYIELGKTYLEIRDDAAAQEFFSQALIFYEEREKDWLYVRTLIHLGEVHHLRRNYEDAIASYEQAIDWGTENGYEVPIEAYYATASDYYYLDVCRDKSDDEWRTGAVEMALEAFNIYKERKLDDTLALENILKVFVLCRDWAEEPYIHRGAGFVNGFPIGYEEPCVYVVPPGEEVPEDICPNE